MDVADNSMTDVDIVGSVLDIPFEDDRFRGVILSHVLEHLYREEHKKALLEIRRVLKMGGRLYLEVPDFEVCMQNYLDNYLGRKEFWYQCVYGRGMYNSDYHKSGIAQQYLTDLLFELGYGKLQWIPNDRNVACLAVFARKVDTFLGERL
jgi:SAM-dependent methyltransferase